MDELLRNIRVQLTNHNVSLGAREQALSVLLGQRDRKADTLLHDLLESKVVTHAEVYNVTAARRALSHN
jgi:hypothetical protein